MSSPSALLGDPRAEHDRNMLGSMFLETADYRTLLESGGEKTVVVGRRGTGKSAIAFKLKQHWRKSPKTVVASLSPDEDQMIGLRGASKFFGDKFKNLRAGSRIIWKYALLMESVVLLLDNHKAKKYKNYPSLAAAAKEWMSHNQGVAERVRKKLKQVVSLEDEVEDRIGELASTLKIRDLENDVINLVEETGTKVRILIDRLDEGYEPDDVGVAIVDGIVLAAIDLNSHVDGFLALAFLRDNIYRTITQKDPDFTRNIEGQTLRLHWDEVALFNLVCMRLKSVFSISQESSAKVWNYCANRGLEGRDGFRKCLRLTLYRPRDVLILLNGAFYAASKSGRKQIVDEDIDGTAKTISVNRFEDLKKEYEAIIPGIGLFLNKFKNGDPERSVSSISPLIDEVFSIKGLSSEILQQLNLMGDSVSIIRALYSVGFLGVHDSDSGNYVFCHDGRDPDIEFVSETRLIIHPCYWMALNLSKNMLDPDEAEEIYDEYDIEVSSENPAQRAKLIGQIEHDLSLIEEGQEGWSEFEDWCFKALSVIYAGALENFSKKPNGSNKNRRDIVATNLKQTSAWARVRDDYESTQIVFEVKNYRKLGGDEYRQMLGYLKGQYGRIGFIVCRDEDNNLRKGEDLDWMRDVYRDHNIVIVKITAKWIISNLHKIRSVQKHNAPDKMLNSLLDQYQRMYLSGSN